jgi:hypothetical protein
MQNVLRAAAGTVMIAGLVLGAGAAANVAGGDPEAPVSGNDCSVTLERAASPFPGTEIHVRTLTCTSLEPGTAAIAKSFGTSTVAGTQQPFEWAGQWLTAAGELQERSIVSTSRGWTVDRTVVEYVPVDSIPR